MNMLANPGVLERDAVIYNHEAKSLLRFIACGSVDHGKSSLLGRLLFEAKLVLDDQIETLRKDTGQLNGAEEDLDFSLLFDGLAAEREQKITIDLAYRFFATEKRKFIVADAPGHEQYTRNMATGASTADVAILLIDARHGVRAQSRRHAQIARLLGINDYVLAVNKMDLVDFDRTVFDDICDEFDTILPTAKLHPIPMSALHGDNVITRSDKTPWFDGAPLLDSSWPSPGKRAIATGLRSDASPRNIVSPCTIGVRQSSSLWSTRSGVFTRSRCVAGESLR